MLRSIPRGGLALAASSLLAATPGLTQQPTSRLRAYFAQLATQREFSGGALIAQDGRIVFRTASGLANFETRWPNTPDLAFPIASISKTLTATAILQLEERGALRVDDPVGAYLPGWPYPTMTIRHLLSHTSGLPPYNAWFDPIRARDSARIVTNADFLPVIGEDPKPLLYEPGDRGNYDNVNYIVLALLLERVSGERYADYVERHILIPAGMHHTKLVPLWQQLGSSTATHLVQPHLYPSHYSEHPIWALSIPYVAQYWTGYRFAGFGDYVSTMDDLLRYATALAAGRLLRPSTLARAYIPIRLNDGEVNPGRFGLGWEAQRDTSFGLVVGHSGFSVGLSAVLLMNLHRRQTIVVFDNTGPLASEAGLNALAILNGRDVAMPRPSWARMLGTRLAAEGPEALESVLKQLIADTAPYSVSEAEINALGYDFLGTSNPYHLPMTPRYPEALVVFKANLDLFPDSWNVYDSYAEALRANGQREAAIQMYRKSLQLNPDNRNGHKMLAELLRGGLEDH